MIDYIRGILVHIASDSIVVEVGGIGYRVFCPNPAHFSLQEEVYVYTHHHVREDAILLYGFASRDEQSLFRRLIEVSGIGPKVALGIMSGAKPRDIAVSIEQENIQFLTKLPGIGKKTAQRMILDLKDKISSLFPEGELVGDVDASSMASDAEVDNSSAAGVWEEVNEALKSLGYTDAETSKVYEKLLGKATEQDSVDTWIKLALQELYKPER